MSKWTTPAGVAGMTVALTVFASPLIAQDCGKDCHSCAAGFYEGITYDPNGGYDMGCVATETGCVECGERFVNDAFVDAAVVARTVEAGTPEEMAAAFAAYGRRPLVQAARGLVAVRGTKCSEDAVALVVFVGNRRAEALRRLGVRELSNLYR